MVSVAHKYSATEALTTFIFGVRFESSLESSDSYDSEREPWFRGTEVDGIQEND